MNPHFTIGEAVLMRGSLVVYEVTKTAPDRIWIRSEGQSEGVVHPSALVRFEGASA